MIKVNHANRGLVLEELIKLDNTGYRSRRIAVIHKVPSQWLPLRNNNKIASAKITEKAAVDFMGTVMTHSGSISVVFDAKEVSKGNRWYLSKLEQHQYEFLRDSHNVGVYSFLLIAYWELQEYYVLPFASLDKRWREWKAKTGPASIKAGEQSLIKVKFSGYLDFLIEKVDFHGTSYKAV